LIVNPDKDQGFRAEEGNYGVPAICSGHKEQDGAATAKRFQW